MPMVSTMDHGLPRAQIDHPVRHAGCHLAQAAAAPVAQAAVARRADLSTRNSTHASILLRLAYLTFLFTAPYLRWHSVDAATAILPSFSTLIARRFAVGQSTPFPHSLPAAGQEAAPELLRELDGAVAITAWAWRWPLGSTPRKS